MITVKLAGGLGNQMFQYAFGRQLAILSNTKLYLDSSDLPNSETPREYRLHRYNISANLIGTSNKSSFGKSTSGSFPDKVRKKILEFIQKPMNVIKEANLGFDPSYIQPIKKCLVQGYWQNENYFLPIKNILLNDFALLGNLTFQNNEYLKKILTTESIAVHVRRGDYISSQLNQAVYYPCDQNYYYQAENILKNRFSNIHLFIFSDDVNWVKNNLRFSCPHTYISGFSKDQDIEEMYLMTKCKSHIIANSSFSWWGAWLCTNPHQIVIGPKNWFLDHKMNSEFILPSTWITI